MWLKHEKRREYDAVVFNPNPTMVAPNELNLWTGLAIEPAPGDWGLMRQHIFENICQRDSVNYEYLLDWMSQMYSEPSVKSGVVVVLRGPEGVGKSKLGEWQRKIIGKRHSLVIDKAEQLTGKFNAHLEQALFVLAEEAFFAGDPKAKNALKHLATGQDQSYEGKGKDTRSGESYCRVMMPTNEEWAVPVGVGDRRYFVLDVGVARKEDKAYFAAIDAQMHDGGAAAMLHDLLVRNASFASMGKPPMTDAKKDQITLGMSPRMKWLASVLADGEFTFKREAGRAGVEWPDVGGEVPKSDVFDSYRDFVPGFRSAPSSEEIGRFFQKIIPELSATRPTVMGQRVWHYKLPPLETARAAFLAATPGYNFPLVKEEESDIAMPEVGSYGHRVAALDEHRARKSVGK